MNKCRLCQQINNNLTKVHNNRIKYLAQIILKLKGFKDSLDIHKSLAICENCKQGVENVANFWENIPEYKVERTTDADILEKLENTNRDTLKVELCSVSKPNLPALTTDEKQYGDNSLNSTETKLEPLKMRIKFLRKRKRTDEPVCAIAGRESVEKRIRRRPKRYEDFSINISKKNKPANVNPIIVPNIINESSLNSTPQVAALRLSNGQTIAKLVEVKSRESSSKMRIICQVCCEVFCYEKIFQEHLETNHEYQLEQTADSPKNYLFYCKLCEKSFPSHYSVRRHYRQVHSEERPFKCQHCEANFKYKFNLDYHMAIHIPKKRFECVFCKKMFLMRYELQIHVRTHTKERPYKCELCSFASAHKSNLTAHKKVKHFKSSQTPTGVIDSTAVGEKKTCDGILKANTFTPPQILLEKEEQIEHKFINNDISNLVLSPIFKDGENAVKNDNSKTNYSETENCTKSSTGYENNDKKILKPSKSTTTSKEIVKVLPKFGTFQLDCSILNVLPSSTFLELKKWPKSYQSTSTAALSPSKHSAFRNIENSHRFEIDKTAKTSVFDHISENVEDTSQAITEYDFQTKSGRNSDLNSTITNSNNIKLNFSQFDKDYNAKESSDVHYNDALKTTNPKSWNKIKVSAKPVKITNIFNLKASRNAFSGSNTALYEANNITEASKGNITEGKDTILTLSATPQSSEVNTNTFTNVAAPSASYKSTNISQQSLLKPQQVSTPSSANLNKHQTILPSTPLITKIEIFPPLKELPSLQNSLTTTTSTNLVKAPTDYKYQCPYCYKYFKQKSALTKHIRNLCPKSNDDASNYKKHKVLHKNDTSAVQKSPAYSIVSDPDPDGIEVMQTIKKFECSPIEDDDDMDDDASLSSSTMESQMWHDALEHALMNDVIRENIKRNLANLIMPFF